MCCKFRVHFQSLYALCQIFVCTTFPICSSLCYIVITISSSSFTLFCTNVTRVIFPWKGLQAVHISYIPMIVQEKLCSGHSPHIQPQALCYAKTLRFSWNAQWWKWRYACLGKAADLQDPSLVGRKMDDRHSTERNLYLMSAIIVHFSMPIFMFSNIIFIDIYRDKSCKIISDHIQSK